MFLKFLFCQCYHLRLFTFYVCPCSQDIWETIIWKGILVQLFQKYFQGICLLESLILLKLLIANLHIEWKALLNCCWLSNIWISFSCILLHFILSRRSVFTSDIFSKKSNQMLTKHVSKSKIVLLQQFFLLVTLRRYRGVVEHPLFHPTQSENV